MRILWLVWVVGLAGCGSLAAPDKGLGETGVPLPGTGTGAATGGGPGTGGTGAGTGVGTGSGTGTGVGTGSGTGGPAVETDCLDGVDNDGDGAVDCLDPDCPACNAASCAEILALSPGANSGIYSIEPAPGNVRDVYCDMVTDGGGWTLVASSISPVDDANIAWHTDLLTLDPAGVNDGVWGGLRDQFVAGGGTSDIRFACTQVSGGAFVVDLSFYSTIWYVEMTVGSEAQSCFNEGNGLGADPPPARTDNISGATLPAGDQWNAGYLEGEDACDSPDDFTVDFDDRGMDSNQSDGTDWGEDDGTGKCGTGGGIGWFIFVR